MKVSLAREIEFYDLKSKNLYITPYAIANYTVENTLNGGGTAYEKEGGTS